ncbi:hypothetical protein [Microbacterium sp. BH-3-3-3]|uniref:hypothetical protein n=1 Tax=Microbacterium sp. BH-3-3-3 TaxID=1906742 RepID=UPI0016425216|nr:hypothetical protein [Microbacterium sp. BH-3-3-3]
MTNVFDKFQVTYLLRGGSDVDEEMLTLENAPSVPQIGEGVFLSFGDGEKAFRIVDVWTIIPKRTPLTPGVYAFVEEVAISETPLVSWGQGYFS